MLLRQLNGALFEWFDYVPRSTRVNSPIDEAIDSRRGVCQDFAHTMIALVRLVGIPCRYVSGYLYHGERDHDRSNADATHAWVEALLPQLGWVGFDPTNNLLAHARYIRTAIGRDYADVPPTRGVYRGRTDSEMYVAVKVSQYKEMPPLDRDMPVPEDWSILVERAQEPPPLASPLLELQQMQQQQSRLHMEL
jgi:transglutaminase-like putative cysteine protease